MRPLQRVWICDEHSNSVQLCKQTPEIVFTTKDLIGEAAGPINPFPNALAELGYLNRLSFRPNLLWSSFPCTPHTSYLHPCNSLVQDGYVLLLSRTKLPSPLSSFYDHVTPNRFVSPCWPDLLTRPDETYHAAQEPVLPILARSPTIPNHYYRHPASWL